MDPRLDASVRALTEHVLDRALAGEAEPALLDASGAVGFSAAGVWRAVPATRDGKGLRWFPVRTRGPRSMLPADALVRTALEDGIAFELPARVHLIRDDAHALALVVVDVPGTSPLRAEDASDGDPREFLEALVALVGALSETETDAESGPDGIDLFGPLLPGSGEG